MKTPGPRQGFFLFLIKISALKPPFSSKLPNLEASIFGHMNQVARETDAINLAQGFPDFNPDPELVRLVREAMEGPYNQYAPLAGIYSLREAIAEKTESLYRAAYHPESEVTITAGATQAIYTAIACSVHEGDEVIVLKPAYDCYEPSIRVHGGVPVPLQLKGPDFEIDWEALERALGPRTRMIVLNSPHNPSGTVLKKADLERLERLLRPTDVLVLSDEAYEHLVFDGLENQSICRFPGLRERAFVCASFGKTFHVTGWKMGYCLAPAPLMDEFRKVHEFLIFALNHPVQRGLTAYLKDPSTYLELGAFFQRKRDLFLQALQPSRFRIKPSEGTYFQLADYKAISNEGDVAFAERLARDFGVAGIPISVFNLDKVDNGFIRFCFAKKDETLLRAAEILCKV